MIKEEEEKRALAAQIDISMLKNTSIQPPLIFIC